ncbi:hypothetical protein PVK06_048734 [Gossypium arboreum]|uniref:Uncharacterized protein n=1 Tax=Gossypium arboreum TaxID=29729 RepID=A0ABR0MIR1_GOSAR|nr:hypothetical protein PVK06_048734 [Gossypium arboreum]
MDDDQPKGKYMSLRGENLGGNIDVNNVEIELVRHEECVYHDKPGKSTIVERVYEVDDEDDNAERVNNIESVDTLLFDVECLSENEDEEIRGVKSKLKQYKQKKTSNIGNDLEDLYSPNAIVNDGVETARIEGHLKVSDGVLNDGFSKGMDSDDPGDYDSDVQSDDEFSVRRSVGQKYDANCILPIWELGMRFKSNKKFKEAVKKYAFAKGVCKESG